MLASFKAFLEQYITMPSDRFLLIAEGLGLIILFSIVLHIILHRVFLGWMKQRGNRSEIAWRAIVLKSNFFNNIVWLIQGVIISTQAKLWIPKSSELKGYILTFTSLWVIVFCLLSIYALLNTIEALMTRTKFGKNMPLRGVVQTFKIIFFIIASLLGLSVILDKSPVYLLSGLGAMTAVIMLVFQTPIMGLLAGIQLAANKMLSVGDWLEMPKYGADGDVIEITLTTVKVRNWDKTITTIPTNALVSDSFKNWKGMEEIGGRRIKRSFLIDATSVSFLNETTLQKLQSTDLLKEYIDEKERSIAEYNQTKGISGSNKINGRRLTNLGSFRAYLERYLRTHPEIRQDLTLIVRQLAPSHEGIGMELYCFTDKTAWAEYERIQSDIFDHIFAVLPEFGLTVSQAPTGDDIHSFLARGDSA
ncbi:mechanosensitive ion channel [Vibrio sp.]|nr:mechanosensitive ion channel [Vibrio sp.]